MADDRPRLLRVGLTGSVAAGKSSVGRLFESWGAARIDADELARSAVQPGSSALADIVSLWGDDILEDGGRLDRGALRRIVFADPRARRRLEGIVHAEVARLRAARLAEIAAAPPASGIVVEEIPLLYETGLESDLPIVVTVDAPRARRAARARAARGWDADTFDAVEASQLDAAEKRSRADFVIHNDGSVEALERSARSVWEELVRRARGGAGAGIRPSPDVDADRSPA